MNPAALDPDLERKAGKSSCSTSMTFNFMVGAIAIVVAVVVGYLIYSYFLAR